MPSFSRIKYALLIFAAVPALTMAGESSPTTGASARRAAPTAATTHANRKFMQRFVQFINTADPKLASELVSPKASFSVPGRPDPLSGPAGYMEIINMMRAGFPDIQWTLEETIAEGNNIVARYTMRGTHKGTFMGVPPTGKKIVVQALNIYRFSDGQILEELGQPDLLGLLQQIGGLPTR
jgi:steroid delta-isomerase-like uncharacterized protein